MFQNTNLYIASSYASNEDKLQMRCPDDIFCTGLGLFSRVDIGKGTDIGYYGGALKSDSKKEWEDGKLKTHALRAGDSCHVYDGLEIRAWLGASDVKCGTYHKYDNQVEYNLYSSTPQNIREIFLEGQGFMANTSILKSHHNIRVIRKYPEKNQAHKIPLQILRTTKNISAGDELINSYQTNSKVIFSVLFHLVGRNVESLFY